MEMFKVIIPLPLVNPFGLTLDDPSVTLLPWFYPGYSTKMLTIIFSKWNSSGFYKSVFIWISAEKDWSEIKP